MQRLRGRNVWIALAGLVLLGGITVFFLGRDRTSKGRLAPPEALGSSLQAAPVFAGSGTSFVGPHGGITDIGRLQTGGPVEVFYKEKGASGFTQLHGRATAAAILRVRHLEALRSSLARQTAQARNPGGQLPPITQTQTSPAGSQPRTGPYPPLPGTSPPRWGTDLISRGLGTVGSVWYVLPADGGPGILYTKEISGQGVVGWIPEGTGPTTVRTYPIPASSTAGAVPRILAVSQGQARIAVGQRPLLLDLGTGKFAG